MRIAYISFEHPNGIAGGGIGTYVAQMAKLMAGRSHSVEVFSSAKTCNKSLEMDGYQLHLVQSQNQQEFVTAVVKPFAKRHGVHPFDIIESAEYGGDGIRIKQKFPQVPLAVKLHTPTFLISELNDYKRSFTDKLRYIAGGIARWQFAKPYWIYRKDGDPEFKIYQLADAVSSPSSSLATIVKKKWGERPVTILPNVYHPEQEIETMPTPDPGDKITVAFIGKLEKRKGVLDILKAIPSILEQNDNINFRFIGAVHETPGGKEDIRHYAQRKLLLYRHHLQFTGFQPRHMLPGLIKDVHICLFPSIWENFPYVCLESMAAGKAVIASNSGGMAEMIDHLQSGYLIKPKSPSKIAQAVLALTSDEQLRIKLGKSARTAVITNYNDAVIGRQAEDFYLKTINPT